jgi:hypothetical protein
MIHKLVQLGLGILAAIIPANIAISAELIVQNHPKNVTNAATDGNDSNLPANNNSRKPLKRPRLQRPVFTQPGRSKPFAGLTNNQSTYNINNPSQTTDGSGNQVGGSGSVTNSPNQVTGAGGPVRPPSQITSGSSSRP